MPANEIFGSYQVLCGAASTECYPSNLVVGTHTLTGSASAIADTTKCLIDGILISPVSSGSGSTAIDIKTEAGGTLIQVAAAWDNFPTYVPFGDNGLEVDTNWFVTATDVTNFDIRVFFRVLQRTTT